MPGAPEGPSAGAPGGASVESNSAPSGVETTVTPTTPETPITPGETPNEATLDNTTGIGIANKITDEATKAGPNDLLKNIADGKTFTASQDVDVFKDYQKQMRTDQASDEPNIKPDENPVTFANVDEYKKNFGAVHPDDIDVSTVEPNKTNTDTPQNTKDQTPASTQREADTKKNQPATTENNQTSTDTKADVKEPPAKDKEMTGAEFLDQMNKDAAARRTHENWKKIYDNVDKNNPPMNTKGQTPNEETKKPEDKKTETQEEVPENEFKSQGDIQNEIQNQKDEKGNENEDTKSEKEKQVEQMMKMAGITSQIKDINPDFDPRSPEGQKFLKNLAENPDQMNTTSDTLKMLGEQKTTLENSDLIKNIGIDPKDLSKTVANKTLDTLIDAITKRMQEQAKNPDPKKQEENKKNGILLTILKALGTLLVVGGAAAMAAGKEMSKK